MQVRYWNTTPQRFGSPKELAAEIIKNGFEAPKTMPMGFHVAGVYLLAGGRGSIQKILDQTPDAAFQGRDLNVRYLRVDAKKMITVVVIGSGVASCVLGKNNDRLLTELIGSPGSGSNFIAYRDIMPALWAVEAKVQSGILDLTVGNIKEKGTRAPAASPLARSYRTAQVGIER